MQQKQCRYNFMCPQHFNYHPFIVNSQNMIFPYYPNYDKIMDISLSIIIYSILKEAFIIGLPHSVPQNVIKAKSLQFIDIDIPLYYWPVLSNIQYLQIYLQQNHVNSIINSNTISLLKKQHIIDLSHSVPRKLLSPTKFAELN